MCEVPVSTSLLPLSSLSRLLLLTLSSVRFSVVWDGVLCDVGNFLHVSIYYAVYWSQPGQAYWYWQYILRYPALLIVPRYRRNRGCDKRSCGSPAVRSASYIYVYRSYHQVRGSEFVSSV